MMNRIQQALLRGLIALWAVSLTALADNAIERGEQQADQLLQQSGVKGGLVVHVGCGNGKLTAALRANDSFVVQGLDADVTAARENIRATGVYGPVSAAAWAGGRLPYADNTVNLLLVSDPKIAIAENDVDLYMMSQTFMLDGKRRRVKPYGGAGESGPKTPPSADESHLFAAYAGLLDEGPKKQYGDVPQSRDALDAWEGRKGAAIWAVSTADGQKRSEIKLGSPPVFDGMAAANGSLYLSTMDGRVSWYGGSR